MFNKDPDWGGCTGARVFRSVNHFKLTHAKKKKRRKTHLFRIRCAVSTIDRSCEPSRQETSSSWEKEDVEVFLEVLPRFCLRRQLKGLRGNVGEEGRDERESERCKVREVGPRRDGSCWDVWETCPRYANPRLVVREDRQRERVGGNLVAKKKKKRQPSHIGIVFAFHQWTSGTDPM